MVATVRRIALARASAAARKGGSRVLAAFLLLAGIGSAPARAEGDPEEGQRLAEAHCSRCHVIGDFNRYGGIGSTPSFQLLAKRDDWLERFQTFYERRPHPVFVRIPGVEPWTELPSHVATFEVERENIDDLIEFVRTLRPQ